MNDIVKAELDAACREYQESEDSFGSNVATILLAKILAELKTWNNKLEAK